MGKAEGSYRRLLAYAWPYRRKVYSAFGAMLGAAICGMIPPWLLKDVVDDVLIGRELGMLNLLAGGIVGLYLGKAVFSYAQRYLMTEVGQRLVLDLRIRLFDHLQRLSLAFIAERRVGDLLSRITNDVAVLQEVATTALVDLVVQGLSFLGMAGFLLYINWRLTLVTWTILPLAAWFIDRSSKRLRGVGHEIQSCLASLAAGAQEALGSLRIVQAFVTEEEELDKFRQRSEANFRALMRGTHILALLEGGVEVALVAALAFILWLGGRDVIEGRLSPGELIAFLGYLGFMVQPLRVVSRSVSRISQGLASADRIFDMLDQPAGLVLPASPLSPGRLRGEISLEDVHFAYDPARPVLRGLSLGIVPGEVVALVGATGAGKSTLADLVPRFYDPQRGVVRVDGHDLRTLNLPELRRQIGIVPQDPVLLKGTLFYNIAYGCAWADEGRVRDAACQAGIADFIETLPRGYDTEVGERGATLSGGQRQRVAIARALVRDPRILIMDEATASLDADVEAQIQAALRRVFRGRTVLVIAHRLSTVRDAHRILVLDQGRVTEQGTHEELLARRGVYHRLYSLQFGAAGGGK